MDDQALQRAYTFHPRVFGNLVHTYPVISRRAGGVSIGVNLNPDRACNFDCPYCQVDRRSPAPVHRVDPRRVGDEVRHLLRAWRADGLEAAFPGVDRCFRGLADVALSGDGEPTLAREFEEVCAVLSQVQAEAVEEGFPSFPLVVITNATLLHRSQTRNGLRLLSEGKAEVWGKLDAGTAEGFRKASASAIPLERVVNNLESLEPVIDLRIQSLWTRTHEDGPSSIETQAWIGLLARIAAARPLRAIQIHTLARPTRERGLLPMDRDWMESLALRVRQQLPHVLVEVHEGRASGSFTDPD